MPSQWVAHVLLVVVGLLCGCATDGSKPLLGNSSPSKNSQSSDSKEKEEDASWDQVGRQARGDRPVEKENDPLRNIFVSPKAQEIERSLGVD